MNIALNELTRTQSKRTDKNNHTQSELKLRRAVGANLSAVFSSAGLKVELNIVVW